MVEPKTIRETSLVLTGLEGRLGLVQKMTFAIIALLSAILIGAAGLFVQIGDVKTDVAVVKANTSGLTGKLEKMEKLIEDGRRFENTIIATLNRIQSAQPTLPINRLIAGMQGAFSPDDYELVRTTVAGAPRSRDKFAVGDLVPEGQLLPIPEPLLQKVSKLAGVRYIVDANGMIALTIPGTNVVFNVI